MKTNRSIIKWLALVALATFNLQSSTAFAQGTAFTYQGRLNNNGSPASGIYNLTFSLFNTNSSGAAIAEPVTNNAVAVTNGLFTVLIDFGPVVFTGQTNWLEIAVETNGGNTFTTLAPRQQLTPTPYAIFAGAAGGLSGTLPVSQVSGVVPLAQLPAAVMTNGETGITLGGTFNGNATTANNFSGSLSGDVTGTQSATVVSTVGGSTAVNVHAAEQLANAATSAATPNAIVKRDATGSFSATNITLTGNLNLPTTTASAGIIYSGGSTLIHSYGTANFFAGSGAGNTTMQSSGGNTGIGRQSLNSNTTGNENTGLGDDALFLNTTGSGNTAVGYWALLNNTNGNNNIALGVNALYNNLIGSENIAIGYEALYANTTGSENIGMGYYALLSNTNGSDNVALSLGALQYNTSGSQNIAIGRMALCYNTNGNNNIALGYQAGYNITTGSSNIDIGNQGVATDTNIIRIGSGQTSTFIAGVITGNGGGLTNLTLNNPNNSIIAGGQNNTNLPADAFIGGGTQNAIQTGAYGSVLGGGEGNSIQDNANYSVLGGGQNNSILLLGDHSFLGGGEGNILQAETDHSFLGGGQNNDINANFSVISGGLNNLSAGQYSVIPGGLDNEAYGQCSFAAGQNAQALYSGTFVWADNSSPVPFASSAINQFLIRATNGVGIGTTNPGAMLEVDGADVTMRLRNTGDSIGAFVGDTCSSLQLGLYNPTASTSGVIPAYTKRSFFGMSNNGQVGSITSIYECPTFRNLLDDGNGRLSVGVASPTHLIDVNGGAYCNGTSWVNNSDRNSKEAFTAINPGTVLEKVAALPITEWEYKAEADGSKHLGPMAQDFHAAFGLNGADDKHIATVDESGVALAAIQGLNQKLDEKDAEIQDLKQSVAELKKLVQALTEQK
jgi:hypothetical protein